MAENEKEDVLHIPANAKSSFQDFAYWIKSVTHTNRIVSNPEVVSMLQQYWSDPYTQVRVAEKDIVDWTLIPLLRA